MGDNWTEKDELEWGEVDNKAVVFPTNVSPTSRKDKRIKLSYKAAARYAAKTGQRKEFNTPEEAEAYVKARNPNYSFGRVRK